MSVLKLNSTNFQKEVIEEANTVLVDFFADWCGPCKMMSPIVDKIAEEKAGQVKVCKINVDECPDLASKYNVMSIPTLIIFKNGQVINTLVGLRGEEEVLASL